MLIVNVPLKVITSDYSLIVLLKCLITCDDNELFIADKMVAIDLNSIDLDSVLSLLLLVAMLNDNDRASVIKDLV